MYDFNLGSIRLQMINLLWPDIFLTLSFFFIQKFKTNNTRTLIEL